MYLDPTKMRMLSSLLDNKTRDLRLLKERRSGCTSTLIAYAVYVATEARLNVLYVGHSLDAARAYCASTRRYLQDNDIAATQDSPFCLTVGNFRARIKFIGASSLATAGYGESFGAIICDDLNDVQYDQYVEELDRLWPTLVSDGKFIRTYTPPPSFNKFVGLKNYKITPVQVKT